MDPTRPISSKPIPEAGARSVGRVPPVPDATHAGTGSPATDVAGGIESAGKALDAGHAAAVSVDTTSLRALHDAYRSGTYKVDADALADRILDDAFGEETPA